MNIQANRSKLVQTFKQIRKEKILARANFWCCQSCASWAMHQQCEDAPEKKKPIGYVFWHNQDEARIREDGCVYLAFGGLERNDSIEVGKKVVQILVQNGFSVDWNESDSNRIKVDLRTV